MPDRTHGLGRLPAPDRRHVQLFGYTPQAAPPPGSVEKVFAYPHNLIGPYDQGDRQACVGYSLSWLCSIFNGRSYDPVALWQEAKKKDGFPNPGANRGTLVRSGCDVLRLEGHWRVVAGKAAKKPDLAEGISSNLWASTINEVRAAFAEGQPVTLGVDWFSGYDDPVTKGNERWIDPAKRGSLEGGHAITAIGCSDRRQAVLLLNSWGSSWAPTWFPYTELHWQLTARGGEAVLVTDRSTL